MSIEKQIQDLQKLSKDITKEKQDIESIAFEMEKVINSKLEGFLKIYADFLKRQKQLENSIEDLKTTNTKDNINGVVIDYVTFSQILNAICYGIRDEDLYTKLIIMGKDQENKQQKFTLEEVQPLKEISSNDETEKEFDSDKLKDLGFTEISNESIDDIMSSIFGNILMEYIKNKNKKN